MMKFYLSFSRYLAALLVFATSVAYSQGRSVSGKITSSDDGSSLPGVNILEKGTNNGTVSDADGNFTISGLGANATLVVSFVGYKTQEIVVGAQSSLTIILEADVTALNEVVVVGYGTQEKKEITSAVSSVKTEDFNRGNVTSAAQLIQGKVAGLSIVRPGGDPNASPTIRLRGISTFGANSEPLIVLDGVIGASLDNVDPNDIASFDVLKDASAAAIYGARGSSGVILVTTKSGKGGKGPYTTVEYNGFITQDAVANKIDVLSAEEFVARGGTDFRTAENPNGTNWFNELTKTAYSHTHNLSIAGSSGNTTFRGSVNFRDNNGIVEGVNFQRLNTRLNLGHNALDGRLRFNVSLAFNNRGQESINMSAFRYAVIYNPTAPVFDPANETFGGYFQRDLFNFYNPVALARQQRFANENKNVLTNYQVEFDVIENLTIAANYAQDRATGISGGYQAKTDIVSGFGGNGIARRDTYNNNNQLFEVTAKYNTKFIEDLSAEFLIGAGTQIRTNEGFGAQVRNFLYDNTGFDNLGFGSIRVGNNTDVYSYKNEDVLNSGFARANFNYKNFVFLNASIRREAYSGFGEESKTGNFPAVGLGVQVTELVDLGPVNSLKVRASFGRTGNLPPASNLALASFVPGQRIDFDGDPLTTDDTFVSPRQARDPNPTLTWEKKNEWNFGVDYALFSGKITGSMEYYMRDIDDLLYGITLPSGAPNPFSASAPSNVAGFAWANIGSLSNAGFEFIATYNGVKLGPVTYTPSVNFTIYKKTVVESLTAGDLGIAELRLATPGSPGQNNNEIIRNIPGQTLGNMYGPRFLGVNEQNEYVLSTTNPDEFGVIGNGLPSAEFGFNNTFTYGRFDLNFFLRGVFGHDLYNSYRGFYENRDAVSRTWNSVVTDKTPFITSSPTFSSLYVEKADFVRLDNFTIGYNIPSKGMFSKLRVYFTGQNLFTITKYTGIDPEVRYNDSENGDGFSRNLAPGIERRDTYFTTRSLTVGVNVSFK